MVMFSFAASMGGSTGVTSVVETTALRKRRKRRSKHEIIKYRRENNLPLSLSQEKYRKRQNRRARERWRKKKRAEKSSRNDSSSWVLLLVKKAVRSVFTRTPAPSNTTAVLHQEPESTQNDEDRVETAPRPPTEQLSFPHFCGGDARANSHDDPSDSSHCGTAVVGDPCPSDQSHDVMLPIAEDKGSEDESSDSSITESNECSDFCSSPLSAWKCKICKHQNSSDADTCTHCALRAGSHANAHPDDPSKLLREAGEIPALLPREDDDSDDDCSDDESDDDEGDDVAVGDFSVSTCDVANASSSTHSNEEHDDPADWDLPELRGKDPSQCAVIIKQLMGLENRLLANCSTAAGDNSGDAKGDDSISSRQDNLLQVFVRTPYGNTTTLSVNQSTTVADLKRQLSSSTTITPSNGMRLCYGGKPLNDSLTLSEYGITRHSTLEMHDGGLLGGSRGESECPGSPSIDQLYAEISRRGAKISLQGAEISRQEAVISDQEAVIYRQEGEISRQEGEIDRLRASRHRRTARIHNLRQEVESAGVALAESEESRRELEERSSSDTRDIAILQERVVAQQEELVSSRNFLSTFSRDFRELRESNSSLTANAATLRHTVDYLQRLLSSLGEVRSENDGLSADLVTARETIDAHRRQIAEMEGVIAASQDTISTLRSTTERQAAHIRQNDELVEKLNGNNEHIDVHSRGLQLSLTQSQQNLEIAMELNEHYEQENAILQERLSRSTAEIAQQQSDNEFANQSVMEAESLRAENALLQEQLAEQAANVTLSVADVTLREQLDEANVSLAQRDQTIADRDAEIQQLREQIQLLHSQQAQPRDRIDSTSVTPAPARRGDGRDSSLAPSLPSSATATTSSSDSANDTDCDSPSPSASDTASPSPVGETSSEPPSSPLDESEKDDSNDECDLADLDCEKRAEGLEQAYRDGLLGDQGEAGATSEGSVADDDGHGVASSNHNLALGQEKATDYSLFFDDGHDSDGYSVDERGIRTDPHAKPPTRKRNKNLSDDEDFCQNDSSDEESVRDDENSSPKKIAAVASARPAKKVLSKQKSLSHFWPANSSGECKTNARGTATTRSKRASLESDSDNSDSDSSKDRTIEPKAKKSKKGESKAAVDEPGVPDAAFVGVAVGGGDDDEGPPPAPASEQNQRAAAAAPANQNVVDHSNESDDDDDEGPSLFQLRSETISGRPANFDHRGGTGGLWQQYYKCNLRDLPARLCDWQGSNNDVISPMYNRAEVQRCEEQLRNRRGSFINGEQLEPFQIDARAYEKEQLELFVVNDFQPSHQTTRLDRLLHVGSSGRRQGRLYEPCPEFQLQTIARAAHVIYDVDYDVAFILALRTTVFGNALPYKLPFDIRHSGQDNMNIYNRIVDFSRDIQRQVNSFISGECPNVGYSIVFGEPAFDIVNDSWFSSNVENLTGSRFIDHPMRMRFRWITHDARIRIIRPISMFLSRAMGVTYRDPLGLSLDLLNDILWCRQTVTVRGQPANRAGLLRLNARMEELLPLLQNSEQAHVWDDGIPTWLQEYIMGLKREEYQGLVKRINSALRISPRHLGLWQCSAETCTRGAQLALYGSECHNTDETRCTSPLHCIPNGNFVGLLAHCTTASCKNYGLFNNKCNRCIETGTNAYFRLPSPPAGEVIPWNKKYYIDKYIDDQFDRTCNDANSVGREVLSECRNLRRGNPNFPLTSVPYLCLGNNATRSLRSTGRDESDDKKFNSGEFMVALKNQLRNNGRYDGEITIGNVRYRSKSKVTN